MTPTLFADSSAILAWLLGDPGGPEAGQALQVAKAVVISELTLVECDRVLIRLAAIKALSERASQKLRARTEAIAAHWTVIQLRPEIFARARQPFPIEPVRTLDAIQVSTALFSRATLADLTILTLDSRMRAVGQSLGFSLLPAQP
ncbi:MAG: type II toxin-antitoxin system VapC family toxin [Alphaproteobacteria bacterium]|nr:type II toxin-antitoxin system VapC family toxin [Alphaproteobacteria bacterium]